MKTVPLVLLLAFAAPAASAQVHHEPQPDSGLVRLKPLIGSWKGTDSQGKPLTLSYRMVSDDKRNIHVCTRGLIGRNAHGCRKI